MNDDRTVFDLSEKDEDYLQNPEKYGGVTDNSIEDAENMMFDEDDD